jgi:hypothetical protein
VAADADVPLITRRHAQGPVAMWPDTDNSLMDLQGREQNRRKLKRINQLIQACLRDAFVGIGSSQHHHPLELGEGRKPSAAWICPITEGGEGSAAPCCPPSR